MKTLSYAHLRAIIAAFLFVTGLHAAPLGSAFNYNGRLLDGNGDHDFEFNLFNQSSLGLPIAPAVSAPAVLVSNGLFSTTIDFGAGAFDGGAKWLEISVRRTGSGAEFVILTPRQAINPAPYALFAARSALASNVAAGAVTAASIQNGAITPEKLASGGLVTTLNGLRNDVTLAAGSGVTITPSGNTLTLATTGDDWKLGGNAGTLPDAQFLGTTDNQPLTFKVNNNRVLRLASPR